MGEKGQKDLLQIEATLPIVKKDKLNPSTQDLYAETCSY